MSHIRMFARFSDAASAMKYALKKKTIIFGERLKERRTGEYFSTLLFLKSKQYFCGERV